MPAPRCLQVAIGATPPDEMLSSEGQEETEAASYFLEGLSLSAAPTATAPAQVLEPAATSIGTSVTAVLGTCDLLCEILVRLPYPSSLVRAATVSKFWLSNASYPKFLKRFLKTNPNQLLGYYVVSDNRLHPRFVPATHAYDPDVASMLTLASTQFDVWEDTPVTIWDCRNGKILVEIGGKLEVRDYLTRPCSIAAYPLSPIKLILNPSFNYQLHEFLPCNGRGHEYYRLAIRHKDDCIIVCLSLLCGHIWVNRNSHVVPLPEFATSLEFLVPFGKLGERKLYLVTTCDLIIILDIETMRMMLVQIPNDLVQDCYDIDLCPGNSEIEMYLIGVSQSQLSIWSYTASGTNQDTWRLFSRIPIQDVFRGLVSEDRLSLWGFGEKMEFVLLKLGNSIYRLDIDSRKVIKAFELQPEDGELERIFPCVMIWPPTFPTSTRSYEFAETLSSEMFDKMADQSQGCQRHRASRSRRRLVTDDDIHSQVTGEPSQSAPTSALVLVTVAPETDTAETDSDCDYPPAEA